MKRVLVLIALAGLALAGCGGEAEPCPTSEPCPDSTECPDTTQAESDLHKLSLELDQREKDLDVRDAELVARQAEMDLSAAIAATVTPEPDPESEPTTAAATFGTGIQLVGIDVEPGQYTAPGGELCYWERLSGTSGGLEDILANDLPSGKAVVTILPSDVAFDSSGCGMWQKSN
ncbi:MAG: hypothetical protein FWG16_01875 [Micrococcales bacterium]|nr:hypothetical protein [Micrococcales bacterium]